MTFVLSFASAPPELGGFWYGMSDITAAPATASSGIKLPGLGDSARS
jgi:hypothetical protein